MKFRLPPRWRIAAQVVAAVLILVTGVFFYLFPWALDNEAEPGVEGPRIPVISTHASGHGGLDAYAHTCSYCHDRGIGPDLRTSAPDAPTVQMFVRHGNGAMPAFRPSEINDADLVDLAGIIAAKKLPAVKP